MAQELTPQGKLDLIKSQLQEVIREEEMAKIILEEKRPMSIYWGTATTGRPHCGYFVPIVKIAHFLRAQQNVTVLLADVHAYLDNLKSPIEQIATRAEYYRRVVQELLKVVGVDITKLKFVLGSSFQYSSPYTQDILKLASIATDDHAKKAGAEVVKQSSEAPLTGLLYPLYQSLDEEYLKVDAQFGGVDQRKIFVFAATFLPKIGYKQRVHLMNPMVPGLAGGKMSSSDPDSKIDLLDKPADVKKKIRKAFAEPKVVEGNGLISFIEYVLGPVSQLSSETGKMRFIVERREEAEPLIYEDIDTLKADYVADKLTPQLLKAAVADGINNILAPIQAAFEADQEWQEIEKKAYPPPEVVKKVKKEKNRGTMFPGAKKDRKDKNEGEQALNVPKTAEQTTEEVLAKDVGKLEVKE